MGENRILDNQSRETTENVPERKGEPDAILKAVKVSKSFGGAKALNSVDFSLRQGEILGLIGENGAGKSTLIKILSGQYTPDAGEIYFCGRLIEKMTPADALGLGIRVISQEFNLLSDLSVAENICIGDYPTKSGRIIDWAAMNRIASEVIGKIGEKIDVTRRVGLLTVAQQQIVEIAKALRRDPKVLIMDEPTAALNDQETSHLFDILRGLRNEGVSIIFITHRLQEQFQLSDRITVLRDGCLIGTVETDRIQNKDLIAMMIGKELGESYTRKFHKTDGDVLFEIRDLCVDEKVRNCNLKVRAGEIVSIFGLLGQNQEALSAALIGDIKATGGEMFLHGEKITLKSPVDSCRAGIGYISDDRKKTGLLPLSTTRHNISISALPRVSNGGVINFSKETDMVGSWIERMKIKCSSQTQNISSLSGGNQQKAMIARWLANRSQFIVLNLPTRGVDVGAKYDIYEILEDLCSQGVGVLVFSLELPEVLGISDRIYVMRDGMLVREFGCAECDQELLMHHAIGSNL